MLEFDKYNTHVECLHPLECIKTVCFLNGSFSFWYPIEQQQIAILTDNFISYIVFLFDCFILFQLLQRNVSFQRTRFPRSSIS